MTVGVRSAAEMDAGQGEDHRLQNRLKLITKYSTDIKSVWLRFVVIDDQVNELEDLQNATEASQEPPTSVFARCREEKSPSQPSSSQRLRER